MGLQPVDLRRSFHPFPQHGGTSFHKVDGCGWSATWMFNFPQVT